MNKLCDTAYKAIKVNLYYTSTEKNINLSNIVNF